MALADEVTARYGDQFLVNLTNPFDEEPTTVDTTRLAKAVLDVIADFKTYASVEYDNDEDQHVSLACEGVIVKLMVRCGELKPEAEKAWRKEDLKEGLALVTGRDRLLPTTNSILQTSSEARGSMPVRADFDRERWDKFVPGEPSISEDGRLE